MRQMVWAGRPSKTALEQCSNAVGRWRRRGRPAAHAGRQWPVMPCPHCLYTCLAAIAVAIGASYREWRGRARRHHGIGAWRLAGPCCAPPRSASGPSPRAGAGSYRSPVLLHAFCRQCGRHPPLHADVRTARRRGRRGRRGTRHGRHRRDGRDGRRRRRGRHNQLPSLRGRSAPRTGQLYHRQTGLTAVASCWSMPCRFHPKGSFFLSFRKNMDQDASPLEPPKALKVHSGPPAVHLDCRGNTREK